jgi:soluble lytic murein transglycosylase-like protein
VLSGRSEVPVGPSSTTIHLVSGWPASSRVALSIVVVAMLGACGNGPPAAVAPASQTPPPVVASGPTVAPAPVDSPAPVFAPAPDRALPTGPGPTAAALVKTTDALHASIGPWRASRYEGDPPRAVVLQALYQQRLYRALAKDPTLWRATRARLPHRLRSEASANVAAVADLRAVVSPVGHAVVFRVGGPTPADDLLRFYHRAQRRFGVPWNVLAAVNFVESKFDRARNASSAGAQGPMQFLPSTWREYGLGGDVHDPGDAVMGAANYLHADGAPGDLRRAVFVYNRSPEYVDAVLSYAHRMRVDRDAFAEYYSWQVFVATPNGDRRLTGPGL